MRFELTLDDDEEQQPLAPVRSPLPTTAYATVCKSIEPDTRLWDGLAQIANRFAVLTEPLPLAGANAMRPLPSGELAITARLRAAAPWLENVIALLDEQLRVQLWAGRPWIAFRPLLMLGAPGTGKSHLARLIADTAGTGRAILNMGGMYDASILTGSPRSYTSPGPCFPATVMAQTRTANPIICGDELEKVATDHRMGHPHAALLNLLEPGTAGAFYDKCLLAEIDVSHVNWLFTANTLDGIAAPLWSRLDIVEVSGPGEEHFDGLLAMLAHSIAGRWGVLPSDLPELAPTAQDILRSGFARRRSVRQLARGLHSALAAGLRNAPRRRH